jgi:hypothetical protein
MQKSGLTVLTISGLLLAGNCPRSLASPLDDAAKSHVEGNAPPPSKFDKILKRDLTAYFQELKGKGITVKYQYLRKGATQSGVSYPKYYLWVSVYKHKKVIDAGAVRVAAIDQTEFEITDYLSKAQIRKNPKQIDSVFPQPVCVKIRQLMK